MSTPPANVIEFVQQYGALAAANWQAGGSPPVYTLAHAGTESGWGKHAPGNNFFGIKAASDWKGDKQLLKTWESAPTRTKADDLIKRIKAKGGELIQLFAPGEDGNPFAKAYGIRVRDFFAAYPNARGSFQHHDDFLRKYKRYAKAWDYRTNSVEFGREVVAAGYGTDPAYLGKLNKSMQMVSDAARLIMGGSVPATNPTTTNTAGGISIVFGANADRAALKPWALDVIRDAMEASGNRAAKVTSTRRTPEDQARAMLQNLKTYGASHQRQLYGSAGDKVVDAYAAAKARGMSDSAMATELAAAIRAAGPGNVSKHMGDFDLLAVIDIAPSSLTRPTAFYNALKKDPRVSKVIGPPADPAYHVEIPAPAGSSGGGDDGLMIAAAAALVLFGLVKLTQ